MKQCSVCKTVKSLCDFSPDRRKQQGVTSNCKECRARGKRQRQNGTYEYKRISRPSDGVKKVCAKCLEEKENSQFNKNNISPDGLSPWCKQCTNNQSRAWAEKNKPRVVEMGRKARLKRKFDITVERYDELLERQGGHCAICGNGKGNSLGALLSVDHNHETGEVRGLLCTNCNFGIGNFKDNAEYLKKAIAYLSRPA